MKTNTLPTLINTTIAEPTPTDAIRVRAYELYTQRGMAEGNAVHDWLAAEAELAKGESTTAAGLSQKSRQVG
jgi:Protein of unknown function (DUF2934)